MESRDSLEHIDPMERQTESIDQKDLSEGLSVTLNTLLDEQRSLNMRMLFAIQIRDQKAQEELRKALNDIDARIEQFLASALGR